jgi:hypothetical protein
MSDIIETVSIREVLEENYIGIGATGAGVIGAIIDDLINARLEEFIAGMATSRDEVSQVLTSLIVEVQPYLSAVRTPQGWVQV